MRVLNHILTSVFLFLLSGLATANVLIPRSKCNADNCLRALRASAHSADSHAFCSAYIDLTTRTVTIIDTVTTAQPAPTTTVETLISITVRTTVFTTQVTTQDVIETITTTLSLTSTLGKRDPVPAVPSYLSACQGLTSRLSSACACYIGTTASDQFSTVTTTVETGPESTITVTDTSTSVFSETDTSVTTQTDQATTTTTTTILSTETAACHGNTKNLSSVFLRIEGATDTIFEGEIISGPRDITTPSGGTHHCDGTNNGNNPTPGATCTTALDEASCRLGFPYDGTFSTSFDDYFITSISTSTQTNTQFWGLLLNYQFTPVGGCQQETAPGDNVLWAFDAFNAVHFLQASPNSDFSTTVGVGNVGVPKNLYVRDGSSGSPVSGVSIGGAITDANGVAVVDFASPGTFTFKATKSDSIRSNAVKIAVSDH